MPALGILVLITVSGYEQEFVPELGLATDMPESLLLDDLERVLAETLVSKVDIELPARGYRALGIRRGRTDQGSSK